MSYVFLNNQLVNAADAHVSVQDRGFRYGDSVFETVAVYEGVPYQFNWHMDRLARGLTATRINHDVSKLHEACRALLKKNAVSAGLLRIQITRGNGGRGYLPDKQTVPTVVIETAPMPHIAKDFIALWLSGYEKISARALPVTSKLGQGLNSILARMEAEEHHCADALLLNNAGHIAETSAGNIFWLKNKTLYTPALSCGVLEGSTRAAILRFSTIPAKEIEASVETLKSAEAVFITNAVWGILPVGLLRPANHEWNSLPAAEIFHELLMSDIKAHCQQHRAQW